MCKKNPHEDLGEITITRKTIISEEETGKILAGGDELAKLADIWDYEPVTPENADITYTKFDYDDNY